MIIEKEKIEKVNNLKFDIKHFNDKYGESIDCFRYKMWLKKDITFSKNIYQEMVSTGSYKDNRRFQLITLSWKYLKNNIISFLSPAFSFNRLIQSYIDYLNALDEHCPMSNIEFVEYFCSIHTCLISIKTGLDRIAQLFSYYYKGVSKSITFGHIKDSGKYTSFLSYVDQKIKANDEDSSVFQCIMDNYHSWIKECVSPRDQIIHYNDINVALGCNEELGILEPIGFSKASPFINIQLIRKYTCEFYNFIDMIFDYFLFESNLISPCDYNGLYLPTEKVEKYLNDLTYYPFEDASLKPIFNPK